MKLTEAQRRCLGLFANLPAFPVALSNDELRLLAALPEYEPNECVQEIGQEDEAACRSLERKGLVKVRRWKDDPIAIRRTLYAGKLPAASLRSFPGQGETG